MKTKDKFLTKRKGVKGLLTMALGLAMAAMACVTVVPGTEIKAKAAGTGKNLQIGSAVLAPVMASVEDTLYTPPNTKDRVTTAQTVYYGSSGTQKWLAIGYGGTGAVKVNGTVTLFATDNIEIGKEYQAAGTGNSYVDSDIRKILIGDSNANGEGGYYSSKFDSVEKTAILGRTLIHGDYSSNINNLCDGISDSSNNPTDKLWLLSTKEADLLKQDYRTASDFWWLRSPGDRDYDVAYVFLDGTVHCAGFFVRSTNGVRPAFDLNLQSIIFTSAASGGKSSGAVGADALQAVGDSASSTEWKLTIADSARNGFSASRTDSNTLTAGGTAEITYSGAQTGTNEYVSVIITDANDTVLYYGNIASCETSDTGIASINIPAGAPAGSKLYVFQEKCNGNNKTDYSSDLINLATIGSSGVGLVAGAPANTQDSSGEEAVDDTLDSNYFDELTAMLEEAKELGGPQTIYWHEGTALPGPVMKFLSENPQITLVFSYTYEGLDYTVTIPGKNVKYDPNVPWCGPLYLYGMYGRYSASTPVKATNSTLTLGNRTYTITTGDSLWDIARRLGSTVDELVGMNNIADADRINIGQIIRY